MFRDLRLVSSLVRISQRNLALQSSVLRSFASDSVFVKNISAAASEDELRQFMQQSGEVVSCSIPKVFGQNKGFAFVQFASEEQAQKAIAELNNATFLDQIVQLSEKRTAPLDKNKIFVTKLPQTEWEQVEQHFQKFGTVKSCRTISRDDQTVSAFIEFESEESASRAVQQQTDNFDGTEIEIKAFVSKKKTRDGENQYSTERRYNRDDNSGYRKEYNSDQPREIDISVRAYVSNIPSGTSYGELKDFFRQVADVTFVRLLKDKITGEPTGAAFVDFADQQARQTAISQLNQAVFKDSNLSVKPFMPRPRN